MDIKTGVKAIQNKWHDFISPILVWWIVWMKRNSWASALADQIIGESQEKKLRNYKENIRYQWYEWMHPERGGASLLISLAIILLPQILLSLGFYNYIKLPIFIDTKAMQEILVATWQVLASLIGIAFVIIVFLTQYVVDRKFEKRALPLFASRTWMVFTVMMGLLTLLSMGINVLLFEMLSHPENNPKGFISEFVVSLSLYNLVLFALNIFLTIRLYIVTYKLLSPNYFQDEFRKYLQKLVNKGVQLEFRNRISKKLILDQCNQNGIKISYFDSYPNKTPVVLPGLSRTISEIIDVNLYLLYLVSKRTKDISWAS